jgi:hypothetical protein
VECGVIRRSQVTLNKRRWQNPCLSTLEIRLTLVMKVCSLDRSFTIKRKKSSFPTRYAPCFGLRTLFAKWMIAVPKCQGLTYKASLQEMEMASCTKRRRKT